MRCDLTGMNVTVMGLGRFGGGVTTTRWLASQGAIVTVTDIDHVEKLQSSVDLISDLVATGQVKLALGGHHLNDFTECDMVVANPAVPRPWENRFLQAALSAGVRVTTEIGLVVSRLNARERVLAVTGSAGKSTTAAMIHHILETNGREVVFGGNIGGSLLPVLENVKPGTFVVLELSSAMLHWLNGWSPHVAVVTNFSPNHLDWHGCADHYKTSKQAILSSQTPGNHAVLGADVEVWTCRAGVHRHIISSLNRIAGLAIPGEHNQRNAAMAVHAARLLDPSLVPDEAIASVRKFGGLPHRLQFVAEVKGRRFYNDSKSTTPESALMAVRAFETDGLHRIHLIAGGYNKGSSLADISELARSLGGLYTIGVTGPGIAQAAGPRENVYQCETLERAVEAAMINMQEGDLLLLSTGCASWDQFANYERRGELFVRLVKERAADGCR